MSIIVRVMIMNTTPIALNNTLFYYAPNHSFRIVVLVFYREATDWDSALETKAFF